MCWLVTPGGLAVFQITYRILDTFLGKAQSSPAQSVVHKRVLVQDEISTETVGKEVRFSSVATGNAKWLIHFRKQYCSFL